MSIYTRYVFFKKKKNPTNLIFATNYIRLWYFKIKLLTNARFRSFQKRAQIIVIFKAKSTNAKKVC